MSARRVHLPASLRIPANLRIPVTGSGSAAHIYHRPRSLVSISFPPVCHISPLWATCAKNNRLLCSKTPKIVAEKNLPKIGGGEPRASDQDLGRLAEALDFSDHYLPATITESAVGTRFISLRNSFSFVRRSRFLFFNCSHLFAPHFRASARSMSRPSTVAHPLCHLCFGFARAYISPVRFQLALFCSLTILLSFRMLENQFPICTKARPRDSQMAQNGHL